MSTGKADKDEAIAEFRREFLRKIISRGGRMNYGVGASSRYDSKGVIQVRRIPGILKCDLCGAASNLTGIAERNRFGFFGKLDRLTEIKSGG
jgi:hypothetical protein